MRSRECMNPYWVNRIEVAEHNVTAGHELYSRYSSAAVAGH
jgi:hypothetical protein